MRAGGGRDLRAGFLLQDLPIALPSLQMKLPARLGRQFCFYVWLRLTRKEPCMSKLIAIMSMSLDGFVADRNDGVAEVFDWYFNSGDVEFNTGGSDPMTFTVSEPSAKHLRSLWSELGGVLTG